MTNDEIPEDVKRLISDRIDSVAQLEAIVLLHASPEQEWRLETVASRLYVSPRDATELLAILRQRGLLVASGDTEVVYRYGPSSDELARTVDRLVETYKQRLIPITKLIHSKPSRNVQRFADAFIMRRDG
ncbi:MAG: hypothetical protein HY329_03675 [Chloroflexi bacterium]|nr:hypothetical protein [Chloroflexota bacterium]